MKNLTARLSAWLFSRDDAGYSTETVVVTALLVGVAVFLGGAIMTAVTEWAADLGKG